MKRLSDGSYGFFSMVPTLAAQCLRAQFSATAVGRGLDTSVETDNCFHNPYGFASAIAKATIHRRASGGTDAIARDCFSSDAVQPVRRSRRDARNWRRGVGCDWLRDTHSCLHE